MKRVIIPFLLFLVFTSSVYAGFERYEGNPVIKPDTTIDKNGASSPSLLYENGVYKMWYNSYDGIDYTISYATSSDGIGFVKYANNPIIRPQKNNQYICERWVHDPFVLWNSTLQKYQMWFTAACDPPPTGLARWWIKYADSSDGISWNIREEPVLYPSSERTMWDVEGVTSSSVVYKNGSYQMWFAGRSNGGAWRIGYATSSDGILWTKYSNNPVLDPTENWDKTHVAGPEVTWDGSQYVMVYYGAYIWPPLAVNIAYSDDGIVWTKPSNENPLVTVNQVENYVGLPSLFRDMNGIKVYYSADYYGVWNISFISDYHIPVPTPTVVVTPNLTDTPTPSTTTIPTSTPSFTPTPTPTIWMKKPIILIPGLFASWNRDAILHNSFVLDSSWALNPIVHEYDGIMKSLENIGYVKNEGYFLFAYDWRKDLTAISDSLHEFIRLNKNTNNQPIQIIGHSLGGLVGRVYTNRFGVGTVDALVTLGSPHQGVPQVYPALSAGYIERDNSFFWLAQKSVLVLNKSGLESDKKTIQRVFPVLYDLLPLYDYLQDENGIWVSENSMNIRNKTLNDYEQNFSELFPQLTTIYGSGILTHRGYTIKKASFINQTLGNYVDGEPNSKQYDSGDGTVTAESALADRDAILFTMDHGDLVVQKDSIKKIFDILSIPYSETSIVAGNKTIISPSLIFFMRSPAEMEVVYGDEIYKEQDGIVFIPNAQLGTYVINVQGKEKGDYSIVVGQITGTDDWWDTIHGSITSSNPTLEKHSYVFTYPDKDAFLSPTPTLTLIPTMTPTPTMELIKTLNESVTPFQHSETQFHPSATPFHPSATPSFTPTPFYSTEKTSSEYIATTENGLLNKDGLIKPVSAAEPTITIPHPTVSGQVLGASEKDNKANVHLSFYIFSFLFLFSTILGLKIAYAVFKNTKQS